MERVQKILARAGIASRRKAEELITEGLVTINGKVANLGDKADPNKDAIKVRGKLLLKLEEPVYLLFNKPKGVISMMEDPEGRPTLAGYLGKIRARVFPIGRLDYNSEGALLLTNDGEIANRIQKRDDIPRVYHVKVKGHPTPEMISRLERGGRVAERLFKPHSVRMSQELTAKSFLQVVIAGSANADLKAYFESKGFLVDRLIRTAIGQITLKGMKPGEWRYLQKSQLEALLNQPELAMRALEKENEEAEERAYQRERDKERDLEREERRTAGRRPAPGKKVVIRPLDKPAPRADARPAAKRRSHGSKPALGSRSDFGEKYGFTGEKRGGAGSRPAFGGKPRSSNFGGKPRSSDFSGKPRSGGKPAFARSESRGPRPSAPRSGGRGRRPRD